MNKNDLYRALREARMSRNEAEALRVLQHLVALDPQDKDAAAQLADLKKRIPEPPRPKATAEKNHNLTKELFRKLRQAIIDHDDYAAFQVVEKILAIDPQNKDAEQQRHDLGRRLAATMSKPLKQQLEAGDLPAMVKLVTELRRYAAEDYLETLPDYSAAAYLVNAELKKTARLELQRDYASLLKLEGEEARENAARALERKAMENTLSFEPEQRAELEKIHASWQEILRIRDMYEQLAQQQQVYDDCRESLRQNKNYAEAVQTLSACIAALKLLAELPEAQALLENVEKRRQRLQEILTAISRGKAFKSMAGSCAIALCVCTAGVVGYACCTAGEMNAKLLALRQSKQVQRVQETLYAQRYIAPLAAAVDSDYAATRKQSQAWVNDWKKARTSFEKTLKELELLTLGKDSAEFSRLLTLVSKVEALDDLLTKEYTSPPTQAQKILEIDLVSRVEERKDQTLQRYISIPTSVSLQELRAVYAEYKMLRDVFKLPDDKQKQVRESFINVLVARWGDVSSTTAVERHLREFDEICVEMELPQEMRNVLTDKLGEFKTMSHLERCRTVEEYVAHIKAHPVLLEFAENACSLDSLVQTAADYTRIGNDLAIQHRLKEMYSKNQIGGVTAAALQGRLGTQSYLTALRGVYFENASVYMGQSQPAAVNSFVDAMTQTKMPAAWRKDYALVEDSRTSKVWVGLVQPVQWGQGRYSVSTLSADGKQWIKIAEVVPNRPPVAMNLHKMRAKCDMKRIDIQCGLHTAAELLMKIANLNDSDGPVLARAYLFDLVVSMAENLPDSFVGGYGLSASMRRDIKKFKELKNNRVLSEGCWLKAISLDDTRKWRDFFNICRAHDYVREIRESLDTLSAARIKYVGYVNEKGALKISTSATNQLYTIRNGNLKKIEEKGAVPFTPLFILK